ncbi:MAG: PCRF domain-containing protein, partial [Bacteroidia bacterium]
MDSLIEKLESLKHRYDEIGTQLGDPGVIADQKRFRALTKSWRDLEKIVDAYRRYQSALNNVESAKDVIANEKDDEFRAMAKEELEINSALVVELEEEIRVLLLPQDPEDSKNAIFEIRAGTGGDEASIFAGDLFRMYTRYCEG